MVLTSEVVDENVDTFAIYKKYMKPWIDDLLGWDEQFQFNGFSKNLRQHYFRWIFIDGEKVGISCLHEERGQTKLSLLIIFKEHQGNGYSFQFLADLIRTLPCGTTLTWNCLKNNTPAIRLYSKIDDAERTLSGCFYQYKVFRT